MLIARAPVRLSFFGGGTDLPSYYERFGGAVLSTAIDKHFYIMVSRGEGSVQVTSSDYRTTFRYSGDDRSLWNDVMQLPKAVLDHFRVYQDLSVFLASEIPPGTGLGSSGAVTVGLVKAIAASLGRLLPSAEAASIACHIDLDILGQPGGKQDQYASAFGGLNLIEFSREGVRVSPLDLDPAVEMELQRRVLLFFTGNTRDSGPILSGQKANIVAQRSETLEALHEMKRQVYRAAELLHDGRLDDFGRLLHKAWEAKKQVAGGITNADIDRYYSLAREEGALGGKIAGAGGAGFLAVFSSEGRQRQIISRLESEGLFSMSFRFASRGATVLLNALAAA